MRPKSRREYPVLVTALHLHGAAGKTGGERNNVMNIGMLWFDNDPKTEIVAKVKEAASYYSQKYGKKPNICFGFFLYYF